MLRVAVTLVCTLALSIGLSQLCAARGGGGGFHGGGGGFHGGLVQTSRIQSRPLLVLLPFVPKVAAELFDDLLRFREELPQRFRRFRF